MSSVSVFHRHLVPGLVFLLTACQRPGTATAPRLRPEMVEAGAGAVDELVRAARTQARQDGRHLVVYVSATWCKPCERFQAALRAGALDEQLPRLRLLKFDHDRDGERLAMAGYDGNWIPRFVLPGDDGRSGPSRVEGGTKADDTVAVSLVPRLQAMLGIRAATPALP